MAPTGGRDGDAEYYSIGHPSLYTYAICTLFLSEVDVSFPKLNRDLKDGSKDQFGATNLLQVPRFDRDVALIFLTPAFSLQVVE